MFQSHCVLPIYRKYKKGWVGFRFCLGWILDQLGSIKVPKPVPSCLLLICSELKENITTRTPKDKSD